MLKSIKKTLRGENKVGQIADKILPFPRTREAIGAATVGVKRGLPVPDFKEADIEESARIVKKELNDMRDRSDISPSAAEHISRLLDILHNGKVDDSRSLSPRTIKIIEKSFSALPILAYLIYALTTGDFSLSALITLISS